MVDIPILNLGYKSTYNWGAPPCMGEVTIKFGFMTWGSKMMLEFWNIRV